MSGKGWNRRDMLGAASFAALALGLPSAALILDGLDDAEAPSERQRLVMREVAELVIPATDTPGAAKAGVGDFVLLALAHGFDGSRARLASDALTPQLRSHIRSDGSLDYAGWLENTLDRAAGGDWLSQSPEARFEALKILDEEAFAEAEQGVQPAAEHPWKLLKYLILNGYYTSEIGGSIELQYAAVPGRYETAIPVTQTTRAFSNEWNGVEFG